MIRRTLSGLALATGLTTGGLAQVLSTQAALSPGRHESIFEVWYKKGDPSTSQARSLDPSLPHRYDSGHWEDLRNKRNTPGSGWEARGFEFTPSPESRLTPRQQVERRIRQEREGVEWHFLRERIERGEGEANPPGEAARKSAGAGGLVGTTWTSKGPDGGDNVFIFKDKVTLEERIHAAGAARNLHGEFHWHAEGDRVTISQNGEFPLTYYGAFHGDKMTLREDSWESVGGKVGFQKGRREYRLERLHR